jgi:hypothetical protein
VPREQPALDDEKYSLSTIMITASARLFRMPATICGSADGRTIRQTRCCHGTRYERAVSISVGSIPRTASIVLSSTGNRQKNAMKATFCRFWIEWSRMIEIGSSAGGGIARQYSMCGVAIRRRIVDMPRSTPSATPTTVAIANPAPMRSRLGTRSDPTCAKSHSFLKSTRIVESRGNLNECACTVYSCQPARRSTGTRISSPTASVRRRVTTFPAAARDASGVRAARAH